MLLSVVIVMTIMLMTMSFSPVLLAVSAATQVSIVIVIVMMIMMMTMSFSPVLFCQLMMK